MEESYNNLFNFKIIRSKNRKRTIGLKVVNNLLEIRTPLIINRDFILQLIEKRKKWILNRINSKSKQAKELINDNKIKFLGDEVDLTIKENSLLKNGGYCELNQNYLIVNISKNYNKDVLEGIIKNWYKNECLKIISIRTEEYAKKYNFQYNKITIKEQKSVWGTCSVKNDLTFNWKIILFDIEIVDYLIVHELVHTIHKNHSKIYWKAVESIIKHYKELRAKLKQN